MLWKACNAALDLFCVLLPSQLQWRANKDLVVIPLFLVK